jgi:hypothetical protein
MPMHVSTDWATKQLGTSNTRQAPKIYFIYTLRITMTHKKMEVTHLLRFQICGQDTLDTSLLQTWPFHSYGNREYHC